MPDGREAPSSYVQTHYEGRQVCQSSGLIWLRCITTCFYFLPTVDTLTIPEHISHFPKFIGSYLRNIFIRVILCTMLLPLFSKIMEKTINSK